MQKVHNAEITAVILAGGRSTRMGQDKATLIFDGRTLFSRTLTLLQPLFSKTLIAGDRPDLATPDIPCVADRYPGSALGGIHGGLIAAATPWILVCPCDLPYPDENLIHRLIEVRRGFDAVVPRTPHGLEPVFALYHKSCLPVMEAMLQRHDYRILDLFPQVKTHYLDLDGEWQRALLNLNTPQDLARLQEKNP